MRNRSKRQRQKKRQTQTRRKTKTKTNKRKIKGGFIEYPLFYIKNALSKFTLTPTSAHGNKSNVKPQPYFQPK